MRLIPILAVMVLWALPLSAQESRQDTGQDTDPETERVVAYQIVNANAIPASLTGRSGDAEAGRQLYFDRERTGCSGCHGSPGGPGAEVGQDGEGAPKLDRVAVRLDEGTIRLWIVAPDALRPETQMPAYYQVGQRTDPTDPRFGEPRLSAAEIEDIVAYLLKAGVGR